MGIQLPVTVELKVVQCDPGIKGASATSRTKPATLETGLVVQVPEYLVSRRADQGGHPQRRVFVPGVNWQRKTRSPAATSAIPCRKPSLIPKN